MLYGIFPAVLLGGALSWAYMRTCRAPLAKLVAGQAAGEANVVLKDVHRFRDVYEVGLQLARLAGQLMPNKSTTYALLC